MNVFFRSLVLLVCAVMGFPAAATGGELSLGLLGVYSSSPYKGHDDTILPFPLISYEGERFFFRGVGGGVHIWKDENQELLVGLSYAGMQFDHSKTDDNRLKRLDDRYSTVTVDAYYSLRTDWGNAGVKASQDILGNSEGFVVDLWYKHPFSVGQLTVVPGIGMQWDSERQADYYYGVSASESRKSGLEEYDAKNAVSPYLSLDINYALTDNWNLTAGGKMLFLSDEIQDSPMVDDSKQFDASVGVVYSF